VLIRTLSQKSGTTSVVFSCLQRSSHVTVYKFTMKLHTTSFVFALLASQSCNAQTTKKPWIFHVNNDAGELVYNENPVLLDNLEPTKLLLRSSDREKTVNTKCVNIIDTASQQVDNPAPLGGLSNALPKGFGFYFGYDTNEDLNGKPKDGCALDLFDSDGCIQEQGKPMRAEGVTADNLAFTVFSFRVWNCTLLYNEIV